MPHPHPLTDFHSEELQADLIRLNDLSIETLKQHEDELRALKGKGMTKTKIKIKQAEIEEELLLWIEEKEEELRAHQKRVAMVVEEWCEMLGTLEEGGAFVLEE